MLVLNSLGLNCFTKSSMNCWAVQRIRWVICQFAHVDVADPTYPSKWNQEWFKEAKRWWWEEKTVRRQGFLLPAEYGSIHVHHSYVPFFNLPNSQIGELSLLPSLTGSFGKNVMETKKLPHKNKKMFFQYIMYVYGTSDNKTSAYYVTPTFCVSCPWKGRLNTISWQNKTSGIWANISVFALGRNFRFSKEI